MQNIVNENFEKLAALQLLECHNHSLLTQTLKKMPTMKFLGYLRNSHKSVARPRSVWPDTPGFLELSWILLFTWEIKLARKCKVILSDIILLTTNKELKKVNRLLRLY